ncbi:MAG: hypothetical protein H7Y60_17980 [Rhodospirillaceae bacterium]|nr:hypothetical protein [Rhodospirillales bacterium]
MAVAWIKQISVFNPNVKLSVRCLDNNRHPKVNGTEYGRDSWFVVDGSQVTAGSKGVVVSPDNLAIPWSYGGDQRLEFKLEEAGAETRFASAEIRGRSGWDYIVFRDKEFRESGEVDVGTLGDAPGINHSNWILSVHSDGKLEWHCSERQGLKRDDAVALGRFILDFTSKAVGTAIDVAETVVKVVALA